MIVIYFSGLQNIYSVWKFEYQEQSMQSAFVDEFNQSALS